MGHIIELVVPEIIHILELMGITIVAVGAIRSFAIYVRTQFKRLERRKTPVNIKIMLGKSLELGLEYKMGAEILKTVLIRDMSEIWILGAIIVLRAMLSLLLSFELRHETSGRPIRAGGGAHAAVLGRTTEDDHIVQPGMEADPKPAAEESALT